MQTSRQVDLQRQYDRIEPGKTFSGRIIDRWRTQYDGPYYQTILIQFADCSTMLHIVWK